ncbi:MAG TPA: MoaD/ThiS family protein [Gemmataceae bacterium]|nr:MoaD/ThiS family protein [Gemmataceae bacterium]
MHVRVKLMAALRNRLPGGTAVMEAGPGATVAAVLDQLGLAAGAVHLVMVNGTMETDRGRVLADGDELVVFPPVAGG